MNEYELLLTVTVALCGERIRVTFNGHSGALLRMNKSHFQVLTDTVVNAHLSAGFSYHLDAHIDAKDVWIKIHQLYNRGSCTATTCTVTAADLKKHYAEVSTDEKYDEPRPPASNGYRAGWATSLIPVSWGPILCPSNHHTLQAVAFNIVHSLTVEDLKENYQ